jgi:hypothetical protein
VTLPCLRGSWSSTLNGLEAPPLPHVRLAFIA